MAVTAVSKFGYDFSRSLCTVVAKQGHLAYQSVHSAEFPGVWVSEYAWLQNINSPIKIDTYIHKPHTQSQGPARVELEKQLPLSGAIWSKATQRKASVLYVHVIVVHAQRCVSPTKTSHTFPPLRLEARWQVLNCDHECVVMRRACEECSAARKPSWGHLGYGGATWSIKWGHLGYGGATWSTKWGHLEYKVGPPGVQSGATWSTAYTEKRCIDNDLRVC